MNLHSRIEPVSASTMGVRKAARFGNLEVVSARTVRCVLKEAISQMKIE